MHADLRDDNILFATDGRTLACDWNWPALGPVWQDSVDLLLAAHGDGLDADALPRERSLTRDVDPDHIDAWLAAICGFMLFARNRPGPRLAAPAHPHRLVRRGLLVLALPTTRMDLMTTIPP